MTACGSDDVWSQGTVERTWTGDTYTVALGGGSATAAQTPWPVDLAARIAGHRELVVVDRAQAEREALRQRPGGARLLVDDALHAFAGEERHGRVIVGGA